MILQQGLKKLAKDLSASFFGEREIELKTIKSKSREKHLQRFHMTLIQEKRL